MPEIVWPSGRRLKLLDPRVVKAFNAYKNKYITAHNGWVRLEKLRASIIGKLTYAQINEYEALDAIFLQANLKAEEECRNFYDGAHDWCANYGRVEKELKLWDLVRKYKLHCNIHKRTIYRYAKEARIHNPLSYSLSEAHGCWLGARAEMNAQNGS